MVRKYPPREGVDNRGGFTAKAALLGDRVSSVVVLTSGTGYSGIPIVTIEPPLQGLDLQLELVPKLTVAGPPVGLAIVEWAAAIEGPWTVWKTVVVESNGTALIDMTPRGCEGSIGSRVPSPRTDRPGWSESLREPSRWAVPFWRWIVVSTRSGTR